MSYNFKDNRGMIIETISFRDATGLTAENIAECMREEAAAQGIPASMTTESLVS